MKRDMDLIRDILLEVEKFPPMKGGSIEITGRTPEEVCAHALLAQDCGLIDARFLPSSTSFHVLRLTAEGHEFLEAARSDTVWNRAKETVVKSTGALTLEGLKLTLPALVAHALKVAGVIS